MHTMPLGLLIIFCTLSHTTSAHSFVSKHADTHNSLICLKLHTHTPTLQLTHLSEASHTRTQNSFVSIFTPTSIHSLVSSFTNTSVHSFVSSFRIAQWLECWTHDQRSRVQIPAGVAGKFLLWGQISVLTLILVSVPPPCYRSSTKKTLVSLPKVEVAGYS